MWILALIGLASVATTIASPDVVAPPRPASLLSPPAAGGDAVAGTDVPGLQRFPDSVRTAYRQALLEGQRVTEVAYVSADPVAQVREFYGAVFEQQGWTVTGESVLRREWTYSVISADRQASVEIDRVDGVTEVKIELLEPARARGVTTDR